MNLFVNGMPCTVDEVLAVARPGDRLSRFLVDLPAIQHFVGRIPLLRRLDRSIAAVSDNVEDLLMLGRNGFADEERPGNVVVDRMRQPAFGPHVHEQEISLSHRQIVIRMRSIVRIRAVRIDGDDGRMPGSQIPSLVLLQDESLDFQLGDGNLVYNASTISLMCFAAYKCVSSCSLLHTASKTCTRSAEETISTPKLRTNSTVPASTREI